MEPGDTAGAVASTPPLESFQSRALCTLTEAQGRRHHTAGQDAVQSLGSQRPEVCPPPRDLELGWGF